MVPGVVYNRQERAYMRRWNIDSGSTADLSLEESAEQALLTNVYALVRSASFVFSGMVPRCMIEAQ